MIRVGTAGWSYPDWEGPVYPTRKPAGFHPLAHLSRYLDCVEINSSFYATPRADYARRWVHLVESEPGFRFLAKLEQVFTHHPLPSNDAQLESQAAAYLQGIQPLRDSDRLAAVLMQFPHTFRWGDASRRRLERLEACFGHLPLVIEVRHRSWFVAEALALLDGLGLSLAEIDLPFAQDHPPKDPPKVGPIGYHRLHGRNADTWFRPQAGRDDRYNYLYDPVELSELVQTTRRIATGRDETFVITNNHFAGKAVANALEILAAVSGHAPLAPAEIVTAFPHLAPWVRTEGQGSLF